MAAIAFALANTSASIAYRSGSNPLTVASLRFLLPVAVLIIWLRLRGISLKLPLREGGVALALGVVTAIYNWALLSASSINSTKRTMSQSARGRNFSQLTR